MNHELHAARERAWDEFLRYRTVLGVGVGPKVTRGRVAAREAIVVLVGKKLPRKDVPKGELIPPAYAGFPTDVREPVLQIPPGEERKNVPPPGDWCRTDVRWIDWVKLHRMNAPQIREREAKRTKPRRTRGSADD